MSSAPPRSSWPLRPWWVAIVSGMASYIDAASIVSFGIAILIFKDALGLDEPQVGLASGSLTLGIAIGAIVGGRIGDRIGRRPVFTATMAMIVVALVVLMFAPSFVALVTAAVVLGLATGADLPVSIATIAEAATEKNRGRLLGFSNLLWLAGALVSSLLGSAVAPQGMNGVRIIFGSLAVITLLVLVGRLTIPESETWKAARTEKASGIPTVRADHANVSELFRAPYAVPFFALIGFYTLNGLVANTAGQYSNYMLVTYGGVPLQTAALIGLPILPVSILGFLWFMKIADKPVRFRYFTVGAVFQVLSPLSIALFGVSLPSYLVSSLFMVVGAAFAFEGIMKVWTQRTFPTLLRTTAQGVIISVGRFAAAIVASVTPVVLAMGPSVMYGILTALALVGCAWAWIVFRTRDKHDEFAEEDTLEEPARPISSATTPVAPV